MALLVFLIVILALAPLPFGSVTDFWQSVLAGLSFALAGAAILTSRDQALWPPTGQPLVGVAAALFCAALAWALVQALIPGLFPHPAWATIQDTLGGPVAGTISLDPYATLLDTISLAALGAVFLAAVLIGRDARAARRVVVGLSIICATYAAYGLIVFASGNDMVAWIEKRHYLSSLTGTFINRNSFGVFMGLGVLAAIAVLLSTLTAIVSDMSERRRDALRITVEAFTSRLWIWLFMAGVCATALLLTGSRGATAATLFAVIVFVIAYMMARRASTSSIASLIVFLMLGGGILLYLSGDFLLFRLADQFDEGLGGRAEIYANATATMRDHLWLGAGYGAFEDAYAFYSTGEGPFFKRIAAAHNVYLELIIELGLPAALILLASVALCLFTCLRGIATRRRDRMYPSLAVAAAVLLGFQGVFDFGIQTPAIATLFAAILGIGVAQSVSSRSRRKARM